MSVFSLFQRAKSSDPVIVSQTTMHQMAEEQMLSNNSRIKMPPFPAISKIGRQTKNSLPEDIIQNLGIAAQNIDYSAEHE